MKIRKLLPSMPWEILEVPNTWKPISVSIAKLLLESEKKSVKFKLNEAQENVRKEIPNRRDIY